jgi:hypothetical protein
MVSHHATLACTRCHDVPDDHLINPRFVRALKPAGVSLCGECHANGADSSRQIPRIDPEEHNPRYMCWDCHYPHYPEAY